MTDILSGRTETVLEFGYWQCPECQQNVYNCTPENIAKHVCMSKRSDEEIDAILQRCLDEKRTCDIPAETVKFMISLSTYSRDEIESLADYAAQAGFIDNKSENNIKSFLLWCFSLGKEYLRQYAIKRRYN